MKPSSVAGKAYIAVALAAVFAALVYAAETGGSLYDARGKRDPFVPLIGADKPAIVRLEDVISLDDIRLEGIAIGSERKKRAILNGALVRENDKVGDVEIKKIERKSVTLFIGAKEYVIKFAEEGGKKE